jgi:hypothetical protein
MATIEATGNTEKEASYKLDVQRQAIAAQTNATFLEVRKHGNFEMGYKLVQEYLSGT